MHLKCLEIERFKSFGPRIRIPLLQGFTVVSGPNGSGKSNIIDALLFALGLAGSRGMRAEKLSDLLHQGMQNGELTVTATFSLSGETDIGQGQELTVSRRLRVNGTNSTSTFTLNGNVCTLSELHERLSEHCIYPEGYNVVLQGDVTGIIAMPSRERREIIDELAGVAEFDRRIASARRELGEVEQRSERFRVVLGELQEQLERLKHERARAEEYRQLRTELLQLTAWEQALLARDLAEQLKKLHFDLQVGDGTIAELTERSRVLGLEIETAEDALDTANSRVRAMGETEQMALRTKIAAHEARRTQLERTITEIGEARQQFRKRQQQIEAELNELTLQFTGFSEREGDCQALIEQWNARLARDRTALEEHRTAQEQLSAASQRWLEEQALLRQQLAELREAHDPLSRQHERLGERLQQLALQSERLRSEVAQLSAAEERLVDELNAAEIEAEAERAAFEQAQKILATERAEVLADRSTQRRLEIERTEKARELDRFEGQRQAWREAEGSRATQEVLCAKLPGVHGLISQLGRVDPRYQTALEVAAGNRLNNIVVEDDGVAARAIDLLKQRRAGRATFLPLSKLKPLRYLEPLRAEGAVGYAIELVEFADPFEPAFAQVFGDTVVFRSLESARRQMGAYRMVTLDGELLEKSGAITGGSLDARRGSGFAASEPPEVGEARKRFADLEALLSTLGGRIDERERRLQNLQSALDAVARRQVSSENRFEQLRREQSQQSGRAAQYRSQLLEDEAETERARTERLTIAERLDPLAGRMAALATQLSALEADRSHHLWQQSHDRLRELETEMRRSEAQLRNGETDLQKLRLDEQLCHQKRQNLLARRLEQEALILEQANRSDEHRAEIERTAGTVAELNLAMAGIERRIAVVRTERDEFEKTLRQLENQKRQCDFRAEQEALQQVQRREKRSELEQRLATQPVPEAVELPTDLTLDQLQQQRQRKQRRAESLEPVNMLAIEEYDRTGTRFSELSEKIDTLERERTGLLLRIEDFDTLKRDAFMQAFAAVDGHFQTIFAELSDGDGHLALENPEHPFAGGLTLIAHPRGKKVRRLEAMSGGEKSLTALSFIFALQRYRPSPFYAFDEVDMFLDGANVERLARMIRQEADLAQFLVVSLRRPMIECSDRAIGVTLARSGHSQVLGVKLQQNEAASQAS